MSALLVNPYVMNIEAKDLRCAVLQRSALFSILPFFDFWLDRLDTANSGTSRVHPGILTLDTVDRGSRHPSASGDGPRSDCVTYHELSLTGPMALTNSSPTSAISLRARSFADVGLSPVGPV